MRRWIIITSEREGKEQCLWWVPKREVKRSAMGNWINVSFYGALPSLLSWLYQIPQCTQCPLSGSDSVGMLLAPVHSDAWREVPIIFACLIESPSSTVSVSSSSSPLMDRSESEAQPFSDSKWIAVMLCREWWVVVSPEEVVWSGEDNQWPPDRDECLW